MSWLRRFVTGRVIRNIVAQGLKAVVSFIGASRLAEWGIEVDLVLLTGVIMGLIEMGWETLKQKTKWTWL